MKTKNNIPVTKAIEEAIKFGFGNRYVLQNGMIHSVLGKKDFPESHFAVVKSYPVILGNGHKGEMDYIVLTNGDLGFLLRETILRETKRITHYEEETDEDIETLDSLLENIYRP